jgi:hypothetical protein
MSDSSQTIDTNKDETVDGTYKESSSSKQRRSDVYQYFTFNESTVRWHCDYCP